MATKTFLGADGNWANVNNWNGAAIPVDADDVYIPDTTSQSLTANLDRTAGTGLHLNSLYVARGYLGNIGSNGNELKCTVQNSDVAAASITHRGPGELWFNSETGTAGHVTGAIILNSDNKSAALTLGGDRNIGRLVARKGYGTLSAAFSATLAGVEVTYRNDPANDVKLVFSSTAGPAVTLVEMNGGIVVASRMVSLVVVGGAGHYTQEDYDLAQSLQSGGTVVFNTANSVGTLGVASVRGGTLDLTRGSNLKTVDNLYEFPGATVLKTSLVTVTNDHTFDRETD